jgi:Protein of unknown function (DUF3175)
MATASKSGTSSNGKRKTTRQKHARAKPKSTQRSNRSNPRRWSHHVMETSDAMDIQHEIFKEGSAQEIVDSQ